MDKEDNELDKWMKEHKLQWETLMRDWKEDTLNRRGFIHYNGIS